MNYNASILIVEDHQTMRRTIADILRKWGFNHIFYAEDGEMAWNRLQSGNYDLVLLDWNMPRMNGMELLRKVRSSGLAFAEVPILMITAEAEQDHVVEAIQAGVTNYVVKPFTPATLERKLRDIFTEPKVRK